ncbi:UDP-N-acetylglucosamine 2-epimerase [Ruegeria sp. ANG-R]|uniref:non-hydrolyzing UDP-N-acetylglucosamine 2-epimerase n=1 Tax=Ruegeria sp. ANG-R TaxID=1577903 RepID=UPI00057C8887|nr:UDP-N-acetylglucosamine 2-epimerase (non-hydrolyzing) [Ruegeria sp. ANG-R]KIC40501.1 UDP-N-acetylglucosamine 2-epimerase [Ruegeria sp. ANG-R]
MKIAVVVGARPQFIKLAPVSRALRSLPGITELLIHTGQHYDDSMSGVFFDELEIARPDINLSVNSGGHGAMTGLMMQKLEPVIQDHKPDALLVFGDTNSTLAGALVAAKLHIPVAHVEAGLRSFNRKMPEETNRVLTDHVSDLLFTTSSDAVENLRRENISDDKIFSVGDVMYDAALHFGERAKKKSRILDDIGVETKGFILATIHRAENTDAPHVLTKIVDGLEAVAKQHPVVLPLHPRTAARLKDMGRQFERVQTIDPVGYLDMVALESNAMLVATDSGGVQKEAYFYGVPCVTLRTETEWGELVESGWNRIVPPSDGDIEGNILDAIGTTGKPIEIYGDGTASQRIARILAARI